MLLAGCCEHEWKEATCVLPKTCKKCGDTEGAPLGHVWVEATCTEAKKCSVCGETTGTALGHNYGEWETVTPATYLSTGEQKRSCARCGETDCQELPKLSADNCKISESGADEFTVTYDECFYLLEEVLNERTNYDLGSIGDLDSSYSFVGDDSIREFVVDGVKTDISIVAHKGDVETSQKDKIDMIQVLMAGDTDQLNDKKSIFKLLSIFTVLLVNPDVSSFNDAYAFFNTVASFNDENSDAWYKDGNIEYQLKVSSIGSNVYYIVFCARIAGKY